MTGCQLWKDSCSGVTSSYPSLKKNPCSSWSRNRKCFTCQKIEDIHKFILALNYNDQVQYYALTQVRCQEWKVGFDKKQT